MFKTILAVLFTLIFSAVSYADFAIVQGSHPKVTNGRVQQVIVDFNQQGYIESINVQYYEGFVQDGAFVSMGLATFRLGGQDAVDFHTSYSAAENKSVFAETWLSEKIDPVVEEGGAK